MPGGRQVLSGGAYAASLVRRLIWKLEVLDSKSGLEVLDSNLGED